MGLFDFVTDLFNGGASGAAKNAFNEQKRLNALAEQLQREGIDYYKQYGNEASGDRNSARVGNQNFASMGLSDRNLADYNLSNAYDTYARANNLGWAPTSGYTAPSAPTNNRTTPGSGGAASVLNRNQPGGLPQQAQQAPQQQAQSPYALAPAAQEQLNQSIGALNQARKAALDNYRAQALQGGGQVNPAFEQYINQHYDEEVNKLSSSAAEQARAQQAAAAAALIQQFTNQRNLGTANYGQSLDRDLSIGQQALSQGANAPFGQYAAQTAQNAGQMGQMGQQFQQISNQTFGDMLQLAAFALSGGFGGASAFNPMTGATVLPAANTVLNRNAPRIA